MKSLNAKSVAIAVVKTATVLAIFSPGLGSAANRSCDALFKLAEVDAVTSQSFGERVLQITNGLFVAPIRHLRAESVKTVAATDLAVKSLMKLRESQDSPKEVRLDLNLNRGKPFVLELEVLSDENIEKYIHNADWRKISHQHIPTDPSVSLSQSVFDSRDRLNMLSQNLFRWPRQKYSFTNPAELAAWLRGFETRLFEAGIRGDVPGMGDIPEKFLLEMVNNIRVNSFFGEDVRMVSTVTDYIADVISRSDPRLFRARWPAIRDIVMSRLKDINEFELIADDLSKGALNNGRFNMPGTSLSPEMIAVVRSSYQKIIRASVQASKNDPTDSPAFSDEARLAVENPSAVLGDPPFLGAHKIGHRNPIFSKYYEENVSALMRQLVEPFVEYDSVAMKRLRESKIATETAYNGLRESFKNNRRVSGKNLAQLKLLASPVFFFTDFHGHKLPLALKDAHPWWPSRLWLPEVKAEVQKGDSKWRGLGNESLHFLVTEVASRMQTADGSNSRLRREVAEEIGTYLTGLYFTDAAALGIGRPHERYKQLFEDAPKTHELDYLAIYPTGPQNTGVNPFSVKGDAAKIILYLRSEIIPSYEYALYMMDYFYDKGTKSVRRRNSSDPVVFPLLPTSRDRSFDHLHAYDSDMPQRQGPSGTP